MHKELDTIQMDQNTKHKDQDATHKDQETVQKDQDVLAVMKHLEQQEQAPAAVAKDESADDSKRACGHRTRSWEYRLEVVHQN
ncbi:hypothetical protein PoB_006592900 [Plakobranchus ocellatus]|uniref:Uncharacterized protein n=1 Tax=Plakobranchus ocellatus TaxID=259542 RepID=A0AAV4D5I4_9GAST|nr:hypothetical protein PoB_006592900 [Plakobranchus ocellatus]